MVISVLASAVIFATGVANAQDAQSEKHAKKATELRQSVFKLLASNMAPLGGMAKGKLAFDKEKIEKNAMRINQLSMMIADYTSTNTSKFKVTTEALPKVWTERSAFEQRINDLTKASAHLQSIATTASESEIKQAIGGVGKTCGGCHDNFKQD